MIFRNKLNKWAAQKLLDEQGVAKDLPRAYRMSIATVAVGLNVISLIPLALFYPVLLLFILAIKLIEVLGELVQIMFTEWTDIFETIRGDLQSLMRIWNNTHGVRKLIKKN